MQAQASIASTPACKPRITSPQTGAKDAGSVGGWLVFMVAGLFAELSNRTPVSLEASCCPAGTIGAMARRSLKGPIVIFVVILLLTITLTVLLPLALCCIVLGVYPRVIQTSIDDAVLANVLVQRVVPEDESDAAAAVDDPSQADRLALAELARQFQAAGSWCVEPAWLTAPSSRADLQTTGGLR